MENCMPQLHHSDFISRCNSQLQDKVIAFNIRSNWVKASEVISSGTQTSNSCSENSISGDKNANVFLF